MNFYYIYILKSEKDGMLYTGYTKNLKRRVEEHNKGLVPSTKNRIPLNLIYFEGCITQKDATQREKYLKTAWGKRYLKNRLKEYLMG
jgi:putative endonuclease